MGNEQREGSFILPIFVKNLAVHVCEISTLPVGDCPFLPFAQDALKAPVVLIHSGTETGAGILVGNEGSALYLITAYHVIEQNPDEIEIRFYPKGELSSPGEIVEINSRFDLVILRCHMPIGYSLPRPLQISSRPPYFRQDVTVVGHPFESNWAVNTSNNVNGLNVQDDDRFFKTSSQGLYPGNSGGPVFDNSGHLMGIVLAKDALHTVCLGIKQIYMSLQGIKTNLLVNLAGKSPIPPTSQNQTYQNYVDPFLGAEMIYVSRGTFQMGSTKGFKGEKPVHIVKVEGYYLGKYEVTQAEWQKVMGSNPSKYADCADCPVEFVSWLEVQAFLNKLNALSPYTYRLPSEAEWEYAAGGGATQRTIYSGTNQQAQLHLYANFCDINCPNTEIAAVGQNDGYQYTAPVGSFLPNQLGFYDMSGNVFEWCEDYYHDTYHGAPTNSLPWLSPPDPKSRRVLKGGAWRYNHLSVRVANRDLGPSNGHNVSLGFRLARTP